MFGLLLGFLGVCISDVYYLEAERGGVGGGIQDLEEVYVSLC